MVLSSEGVRDDDGDDNDDASDDDGVIIAHKHMGLYMCKMWVIIV